MASDTSALDAYLKLASPRRRLRIGAGLCAFGAFTVLFAVWSTTQTLRFVEVLDSSLVRIAELPPEEAAKLIEAASPIKTATMISTTVTLKTLHGAIGLGMIVCGVTMIVQRPTTRALRALVEREVSRDPR